MPVDLLTPLQDAANQMMKKLLEAVKRRTPAATGLLRTGVAWEQILTAAKQSDADLIVPGTHGRTGFRHALLGSVAERVVRLSPVPVISVRGTKEG